MGQGLQGEKGEWSVEEAYVRKEWLTLTTGPRSADMVVGRVRTLLIPLRGPSGHQWQLKPRSAWWGLSWMVGLNGGPFSLLSMEGEASMGHPKLQGKSRCQ